MFKESYYLKDSQKKMFIPYRIVGVFFNGGWILLWRFIHFHNTEWFWTTCARKKKKTIL